MSRVKLNGILEEVCRVMEVGVEEVKGEGRQRHVVEARRMFFYIAREYTHHSLKRIGNVINKDHATVLHHSNKAKWWSANGGWLTDEAIEIKENLNLIAVDEERAKVKVRISQLNDELSTLRNRLSVLNCQ